MAWAGKKFTLDSNGNEEPLASGRQGDLRGRHGGTTGRTRGCRGRGTGRSGETGGSPGPGGRRRGGTPGDGVRRTFLGRGRRRRSRERIRGVDHRRGFEEGNGTGVGGLGPGSCRSNCCISRFKRGRGRRGHTGRVHTRRHRMVHEEGGSLADARVGREEVTLCDSVFTTILVVNIVLDLAILFGARGVRIMKSGCCSRGRVVTFDNIRCRRGVFVNTVCGASSGVIGGLSCVRDTDMDFGVPSAVAVAIISTAPSCIVPGNGNCLLMDSGNEVLRRVSRGGSGLPRLAYNSVGAGRIKRCISFDSTGIPSVLRSISRDLVGGGIGGVANFSIASATGVGLICSKQVSVGVKLPSSVSCGVEATVAVVGRGLSPGGAKLITKALSISTYDASGVSRCGPTTARPATTARTAARTAARTTSSSTSANSNCAKGCA